MRRNASYPEKARTKVKWSEDDTIYLLARLAFIVEKIHQNHERVRKADVLRKLQACLDKRRNLRQIEGKLRKVLNGNTGLNPQQNLEDVFFLRSSFIKSLDDCMKLKVQEALQVIKDNDLYIHISTPRKLRSASRSLGVESRRSKTSQTISRHCTPTKSTQAKQREKPRRTSQLTENKPSPSKIPSSEEYLTVQNRKFPSRLSTTTSTTSIADTEDGIKSSQSFDREGVDLGVCTLQSASQAFFYESEPQNASTVDSTVDYESPNLIQQFPEAPILSRSHETYRDLFRDNMYFREKLSNSEKERSKLLQNERLGRSLLASGSADVDQEMTNLVKKQNDRIVALQHQLNNYTVFQPYFELGRGEQVPLNLAKIQSSHNQMRRVFRSLSIMDCFQYTGEKLACRESKDLSDLKRRVFGDVPPYSSHDDAHFQGEDHTPVHLMVQSLTGAAICEWVFDVRFESTAMMNTPLLEKYRYHLSSICGELALRNLDFAAHQSVVDEEHFRETFLPRSATKLAERLLSALDPFIKGKGLHEAKPQFKQHLVSIFRSALSIKTLGMIGNNKFEFIWPARNCAFKSRCMMEESSESKTSDRGLSEHGVRRVMWVLVPGLRVYSCDRNLVDYCSFTKGDEEGLGESSLVAQAVVVTQ